MLSEKKKSLIWLIVLLFLHNDNFPGSSDFWFVTTQTRCSNWGAYFLRKKSPKLHKLAKWWGQKYCSGIIIPKKKNVESLLTSTYLAQNIETTARPRAQARALSSLHTPVLWHAWLSQFFLARVVESSCKTWSWSDSPLLRFFQTKFVGGKS